MPVNLPLLVALLAGAGLPPAGEWRLESQSTRVKVLSWGLFCGKEPRESRGIPGAKFTVRASGADGFEVAGAGRRYGTGGCSMDAQGFRPRVKDRQGDAWRVECEGPPVNGQPQTTEHAFTLGADGALTYETRGETRKTENLDACRYTYTTTLKWVPATEAGPCASPGAATSLVLSPSTRDLKPGERGCFQVAASDAAGCSVPAGRVSFRVEPAGAVQLDGNGCAWAPPQAAETVLAALTATSESGASGSAVVRVVVPGAAAETLEQTAARTRNEVVRRLVGEVTAGEIVIKAPNEADVEETPAQGASAAPPTPQAEGSSLATLLLLLGMGLLMVGAGVGAWLRTRRRAVQVPVEVKREAPPAPGQGFKCPRCGFEYASGGKCVHDGTELVRNEVAGRATMFIPQVGGMVCPTCGTRYPVKARFCGKDRTPLVPDLGLPDKKEDPPSP